MSIPMKQLKKCLEDIRKSEKDILKYSRREKQHLAFWNGFKLFKEVFFKILDEHEFDFSGCTDTDQVCGKIKEAIIKNLKQELLIDV